jgi:hypothetical protein
VDVEQASHYLNMLYGNATGFGSLILLGNGRRERHCFFDAAELDDDPTTLDASLDALQDVVDEQWNVYASMATFERVPERGRGTRADVASVPGVWADVDVKPGVEGYLASESDVPLVLKNLPTPTLEVASGSGGRHLYWLTHDRLDPKTGQELLHAWLDFLRDWSPVTIENVHDTTRILRLPGTVRWPKVADQVAPMPHKVEILREGPRYQLDELRTLSEVSHERAVVQRKETHERYVLDRKRREFVLRERGLVEERLEAFRSAEATFNSRQDWEPLLTAAGWQLHSDERGGSARCRYWTRPGKNVLDGKSASTDFTSDDGTTSCVMSIYSNEPSLLPLWENADTYDGVGIVTKWKFATRCLGMTDTALFKAVAFSDGTLP